jgi:UDP-4-amino-4,6-dideoxy-N-acetyl-beta-L-altrosamine N-acetyltransferase
VIQFREVLPADAEMLLGWRTKPRVANQMATQVSLNLEDQRKWLLGCYDRPDYYHWVIQTHGSPVGLINLSGFNPSAKETSWGFYIGEESALGFGAFVPPYFYNFIFQQLGLQRVRAEVFQGNDAVIKLHSLHGYHRHPEGDRTTEKDGAPQRLLAMVLESQDWNTGRFTHMRADFPTNLWRAGPK